MKILLLGKNGQVGWELQRSLAPLGELTALDRHGEAGLVGDLSDLDGLAATVPLARYRAWLGQQPAAVQTALRERWGEPEASSMVLRLGGQAVFVVPRLMLGKIAVLPQPPRGDNEPSEVAAQANAGEAGVKPQSGGRSQKWVSKEKALYHSSSAWPSHYYLAAYLWAREQQASDALVHFGTHGSQEWLPGKERGLSVTDPGMLAVGDLPVAYP